MMKLRKRFLTKEEIKIIRKSLLVNKSQVRSDVNNIFSDRLDKYEKVESYLYDSAINILQTIDILYKELDPDKTTVTLEEATVTNYENPDDKLAAFESEYDDGKAKNGSIE